MKKTLLTGLSRLPLSVSHGLGNFVSKIFIYLPHLSYYQTVKRNLFICFPDLDQKQLNEMTRKSISNQILSFIDFLRSWANSTNDTLDRIKRVQNIELMKNAFKNPNGCMGIVPHLGSWELMNVWVEQYKKPLIMYKPSKDPEINEFLKVARKRFHADLVPTDESGVRKIYRHLKEGGFVAILPDHIPEKGSIMSPFFGIDVPTSTLASRLIQKTGCSVIMLTCVRQYNLPEEFEIIIHSMCEGYNSEDLQIAVNALNRTLEKAIVLYPEHYHWNYKRFKDSPGLGEYYYTDEKHSEEIAKKYQRLTSSEYK